MTITTLKFAAVAAALTLSPALAAAETEQRTVGVSYSDLDLTTEEGVSELDRRIESAARTACNLDEHEVGSRVRSRDARECYQQAKRQLDRHFADVKRDAQRAG